MNTPRKLDRAREGDATYRRPSTAKLKRNGSARDEMVAFLFTLSFRANASAGGREAFNFRYERVWRIWRGSRRGTHTSAASAPLVEEIVSDSDGLAESRRSPEEAWTKVDTRMETHGATRRGPLTRSHCWPERGVSHVS
jgi:hypothetical protein